MTALEEDLGFVDTRGQLPPMWPRRVRFFANLLALFYGNEAETQSLTNEVGEIDSYSGRLIPILNLLFRGGDNLLILEREPDEALCRYLRNDLGLSLPELRVMRHRDYVALGEHLAANRTEAVVASLDGITQHDAAWVDGYVTDDTLTRVAEHLGVRTITTTSASRRGNNKLLLHQHLASQNLPTFDTVLAESTRDVSACARELASRGYTSAVIRAQIGASGIGMMRLHDLHDPASIPEIADYFFYEGPCMVQGWLEPGVLGISRVYSPSTQLFLDDTTVYAYDMTEQILSHDSIHQGNISPPPYFDNFPGLREETMRQAAVAGRWLHQTGYRGTASIDWLVTEREGQPVPDVFVCEINARVTGATYPSLLARSFHPTGAWLLRNLRLRIPVSTVDLLEMFERPGHLFHPQRLAGIVPLNLNFGPDQLVHKGQFLCIGQTPEECQHFLTLAERDLPVEWDADRD
ncbi:MAG: hypothetical protein KDA90_08515 [Planctomycetaceae bacterium]|nr:hypothetical protein [Planctomycetaceae bacterium]